MDFADEAERLADSVWDMFILSHLSSQQIIARREDFEDLAHEALQKAYEKGCLDLAKELKKQFGIEDEPH